jgi:DNA-binding NarL/FixJ family response regulator
LRLIAIGLTNKAIAARLGISTATVKRHVANLYAKLGVSTRTGAVAAAEGQGLL